MIKTEQALFKIEAATHPGVTGKQNEDRYAVSNYLTGPHQQTASAVAVLCDGIGGHHAGEIAAEMGVSMITEIISASDAGQPLETMAVAITEANDAIFKASQADDGRAGMGATCAIAWVIGNQLYTANLGDSRIYLLREDHIVQLTTDHTWIQEALEAGIITNSDRESHANAHVIRRYLGSKHPPQPDFRLWYFEGEEDADALANQGLPLQRGDILLLCSDGLTDLVADEEIRSVIRNNSLSQVPAILIDLVNQRGGHDNTTLVLMQIPRKRRKRFGSTLKRRWLIGCLAVLVVLSLVATAVLLGLRGWGGRWFGQETEPTQTETVWSLEATAGPQSTNSPPPSATPSVVPNTPEVMATQGPTITPWPTDTLVP